MSGYELWDTISGNLLDDFDAEADALDRVRIWFETDDLDSDSGLSLLFVSDDGRYEPIAEGQELIGRALGTTRVERA
jgi:hypothetical protein